MSPAARFPRHVSTVLLIVALLYAPLNLLLHELEHGLAGETEACVICLHASHDDNALLADVRQAESVPVGIVQPELWRPAKPEIPLRGKLARAPPIISVV